MSKVGELTVTINLDGAEITKQTLKDIEENLDRIIEKKEKAFKIVPIKTEDEKAKELYKKISELYPGAISVDVYCEQGEIKVRPEYVVHPKAD